MFLLTLSLLTFSSLSFASEAFLPEASGAAKVGSELVISGDEETGVLWVNNGVETRTVKVKDAKWDDMESLATVSSESFFAMTSQSLTKKGKRKPEREQLFLIEKSGSKMAAKKSWQMRDAILSYLEKNLSQKINMNEVRGSSPDEGGLNVEGLAHISGKLYAGLRSPLTNSGEAIILEISNIETLPVISAFRTLKLENRGVRGLESNDDGLIILSGSENDRDMGFGLSKFEFSSQRVSPVIISGFSQLTRPESVVMESPSTMTFVQDFQEDAGEDVIVRLNRNLLSRFQ